MKRFHVSKNILNPESRTTNQQGAERWGDSFPAGTYYILNNSEYEIYYRDGISTTTSTRIIVGGSVIVTTINELVVWHGTKSSDIMVAVSSTALPYEPYGNTWQTKSPPKYGTSTDTLTTLPADIYADGNNATVGLVGNMSQTGTPTPQTPIQPQECGERTANLCPPLTEWVDGYINSGTGTIHEPTDTQEKTSPFIKVDANTDYTFTHQLGDFPAGTNGAWRVVGLYDDTQGFISRIGGADANALTFTTTATTGYIRVSYRTYGDTAYDTMLNTGSTALPYEPYGYKIPISSGAVTTNVYLGEVQSTRRIKQLVLTGQENIINATTSPNAPLKMELPYDLLFSATLVFWSCSHYQAVSNASSWTQYDDMISISSKDTSGDTIKYMRFRDIRYGNDVTSFKQYLADQYAAGTPVTVWYVLATATTGIVNEPLRKIGDYADSVSVTGIPTTSGSQQFDIDTTLKPSEVDLTYHGWHRTEPKERVNGSWV